jgi:ABC-type sugar transport system substrate-binding protein
MKKVFSIVLALALIIGTLGMFSSCGNKNKDNVKIGVMLYNFTDIQGKEIKSYCDYLEQNFDVTFVYESIGSNDEDHINGLQNLLSQGCKAVISGYDTALSNSIQMCEEAGAYYVVALGSVSATAWDSTSFSMVAVEGIDSQYFLGGTTQFGGNAAEVGKLYAQAAKANGFTKIGAISFPTFAFAEGQEIYDAFVAEMGDGVEIYDLQTFMFTAELCEAEVTKLLQEHPDVEAILGLGSGLDYIRPALQSQNSSAKLLALGYNDTVGTLMQNGSVVTAGTNNYSQIVASCFARIWDALNGKSYSDRTSDDLNAVVNYPLILSYDELADFEAYVIPSDKSKGSVTVEELKNNMVTFNENATWAGLNALTNRTLSEIKAARS